MPPSVLVEPAYFTHPDYTRTLGDEVGELAALAGFPPDPEQQLLLDATFAMDRHGKHSAFEVCIICARQNMKTGFFKQVALGKAFILDRKLMVWSAHEFSTAQEAFRDLTELIESCPILDRRVKKISRGNGDEEIELLGGARIKFKARTKTGGRGLSGEDVFLDEGFALQPTHMGALLPTLSAQPDPQVLYGSSAGLDISAVLRGIRDRGRAGDPRLVYMEFCAPPGGCQVEPCDHELTAVGCALDDEAKWRMANPQAGRRIPMEYIAAERRALTPHEFGRERMGWWDQPLELVEVFGEGKWKACAVPAGSSGIRSKLMMGLAVTANRDKACIASSGLSAKGRQHLEPIDHRPGTAWVVARAKELQDRNGGKLVVDGRGPAAPLIPDLEAAGVKVIVASTSDVLDGCAQLFDDVQNVRVAHMSYPELDTAVVGAEKRPVGDRYAWGRKTATDISPLEAVTLAAWGSSTQKKRVPLASFA